MGRICEGSRTRVTVQVGKASALASKREPIGIEGSLERGGANGAEIDGTFGYVAGGRGRTEPNGESVTVNQRDVIEVAPARLTQRELGESDRGDTLSQRGRKELSLNCAARGKDETYGLGALQATDTSSENTVLEFRLAEVAVTSSPDTTSGPIVWDSELLG